MKRTIAILLIIGICQFAFFSAYGGSKVYEIIGIIEKITTDSITIKDKEKSVEVEKKSLDSRFIKNAKPGQSVKLYYTMEPTKIEIIQSHQQPGQIPNEKHKIIEDDRIAYPA